MAAGTSSQDSMNAQMRSSSGKAKRKRPKFIRKVTCQVCGDVANDHIHYGAIACYSCRAFFRRGVNSNAPFYCSQDKRCVVTKSTRKHCQYCRFQRCNDVGMRSTWVMTEEDKKEKKERALIRRASMHARQTAKQTFGRGNKMLTRPELSMSTSPPPLARLMKVKDEPCYSPPIIMSQAFEPNVDIIKDEEIKQEVEEIPQQQQHLPPPPPPASGAPPSAPSSTLLEYAQPMTHESGYSSGRSPSETGGNGSDKSDNESEDFCVATPGTAEELLPNLDKEGSPGGSVTAALVSAIVSATCPDLDLVEETLPSSSNSGAAADLVVFNPHHKDTGIVSQLVLPFTIEEVQLVNNLLRIELDTTKSIPVPRETMGMIIQAAQSGGVVPYKAALDGYTVCMRRVIKFASQLDFFRSFTSNDQRSLLLKNTDMIVNIRSARILRPGVNLQDQLQHAVGSALNKDTSGVTQMLQQGGGQVAAQGSSSGQPTRRLEYKQVFQSPWACDADHEEHFANLMSSIFELKMDKTTISLLTMMALFSVSQIDLEEPDRAMKNQEFFSQLLYRYLCSAIGKTNAINLLPKYTNLLFKLEEMARIMATKRLML